MLFVGDDWAEDHHDVELTDQAGRQLAKARLPEGVAGKRLLLAVSGETATPVRLQGGWAQFELKSILDHEVAIVE